MCIAMEHIAEPNRKVKIFSCKLMYSLSDHKQLFQLKLFQSKAEK